MITDPKVRARRIQKILDRFGRVPSSTMEFKNLPNSAADAISERATFTNDEEGLLASFQSPQSWYLMTTERFVWCQDNRVQELDWRDVRGVQQPPEVSARIIRGDLDKIAARTLEVFDEKDRKYVLHLEPGRAYYLIWSSLVALGNVTRVPDPVAL